MKTQAMTRTAFLIVACMMSGAIHAHGAHTTESPEIGPVTVSYSNGAYAMAISGSPNPAPELPASTSRGLYVDQAYGPAIYSYPGRKEFGNSPAVPPAVVQR